MMKIENIALGMAFGALIGGLGGLLLAPQTGRESREVLQDKIDRLKARVQRNDEVRNEEPTRSVEEA